MKIALIQMRISSSKPENIKKAGFFIDRAARSGAQLAVLPEMFTCIYLQKYFKKNAETIPGGQAFEMLSSKAKKLSINIIGGSVAEKKGKQYFNTCMVFDKKGKLAALHRKTHLFNVYLPQFKFSESAVFSRGNDLTVVALDGIKIGIVICYDIRFPEYIRLLGLKNISLMVCPGAFSRVTGRAHWELLLSSRAVDNQIFMAGCSPAPYKGSFYPYYGHSMVVDPWGRILCDAGNREEIIFAEILPEKIKSTRQCMALYSHRRKDLYDLTWKKRLFSPHQQYVQK